VPAATAGKMVLKEGDQATRMLRSGFGKQVKSPNTTLPAWGFGTAGRDGYQKLYLSPEQAKAMPGNNSQGPVYKTATALGPQPESRYMTLPAPGFGSATRATVSVANKYPGPGTYEQEGGIGPMKESKRSTSPRAVFGSSTRDGQSKVWLDEELMKTYCGRESPGPCNYGTPNSVGKQVDSRRGTEPSWKQGTAQRFKGDTTAGAGPGLAPGAYNSAYNALGKQALSTKKTLPMPKIGTSQRDASKKVFISKEHEKGAYGEFSPGPTTGTVVNAVGPQTLSVKKSYPSWGFGTAKRNTLQSSETPGPGTYWA